MRERDKGRYEGRRERERERERERGVKRWKHNQVNHKTHADRWA